MRTVRVPAALAYTPLRDRRVHAAAVPFAVVLSVLAFDYFCISQAHPFTLGLDDLWRIVLFALAAIFVVAISASQKRTTETLRRERDDLR